MKGMTITPLYRYAKLTPTERAEIALGIKGRCYYCNQVHPVEKLYYFLPAPGDGRVLCNLCRVGGKFYSVRRLLDV